MSECVSTLVQGGGEVELSDSLKQLSFYSIEAGDTIKLRQN